MEQPSLEEIIRNMKAKEGGLESRPIQASLVSPSAETQNRLQGMAASESFKLPEFSGSAESLKAPTMSFVNPAENAAPSLGVGGGEEAAAVSSGGAQVATASAQAVANLMSGMAKANYIKEQSRLKTEAESKTKQAEAQQKSGELAMEGSLNPLKGLIAGYRAALR